MTQQPHIVLLDCNKVSRESFDAVQEQCVIQGIGSVRSSLSVFSERMNMLTFSEVSKFLNKLSPMSALLVADIFWPTGQHICRWSKENNVKCFFCQHGQWIYTANKRNPKFLPYATLLFGDNIKNECSKWKYGKRSKVMSVGSPRYDKYSVDSDGEYVYFAPPVLLEESPNFPDKYDRSAENTLQSIKGLDAQVDMLVHPHYREGGISKLKHIFPSARFGDPKSSALDMISGSRQVLTHRNSTSVLDAIACGKHVVLMNFGVHASYYPEGYFGRFATEAHSIEDCVRGLKVVHKIEDLEQYCQDAAPHIALGDAAQRVASCIMYHVSSH